MNLTNFTGIVDRYKQNFLIRKARFERDKRDTQREKREKRENRIEQNKFFNIGKGALDPIKNQGGGFLDNIIKFAAFTLIGFITKNLENIVQALAPFVQKLKELASNIQTFINDLKPVFEGLISFGSSVVGFIIDINPLKTFGDLLDTVLSGILGIGLRIGGLASSKAPAGPTGAAAASQQRVAPTAQPVRVSARERARALRQARLARSAQRSRFAQRMLTRSRVPVSPGAGLGVGARAGDPVVFRTFLQQLEELKRAAAEKKVGDQVRAAIEEKGRRDAAALKKLGIEGGDKFYRANIAQIMDDSPIRPGQTVTSLDKLLGKPPSSNTFSRGISFLSTNIKNGFTGLRTGVSYLTKGLDFRFNPKDAFSYLKNNPAQIIKGGLFSLGIEFGVNALGKIISDSIPFSEDNQAFAKFGLISSERIAKVRAEQLLRMPKEKRDEMLAQLRKDAESKPFILDKVGNTKKAFATLVLKEYFDLVKVIAPVKGFGETPAKPPELVPVTKKADEDNFDSAGNKIKIGDTVGGDDMKPVIDTPTGKGNLSFRGSGVNRSGGLDGPTSYGQGSFVAIRQNVIAIQPIEVPKA